MKKIRYVPYGYTFKNGTLVVDRTEAQVIKDIFYEYIKGSSLKEIADQLTERGVPYTEKTRLWDKARISRILANSKYLGDGDYDPIIDEGTFESAASIKSARQCGEMFKDCKAIEALRHRVRCGKCGAPMVRSANCQRSVRECWTCTSPACGLRVRITDRDLLTKVTLTMNRIIENADLLIPTTRHRRKDSDTVMQYQRDIEQEMERDQPSEEFIISRVGDIASQLYRESTAKDNIIARVAKKRVLLMLPQESFNREYFNDLIDNISIAEGGRVTLNTKTNVRIEEGECDGDT